MARKQWEYFEVTAPSADHMRELGEDCWELVTIYLHENVREIGMSIQKWKVPVYVFKRELSNAA